MRDLINLFEAKKLAKPAHPAVANAVVRDAVLAVARKLAAPPLFLKPDREWADLVMRELNARKADMLADPENGPFVADDWIEKIVGTDFQFNIKFSRVASDVEHEELSPGGYMTRTREKNGVDPDGSEVGSDVESSQWLTAMDKQADVGRHLSSMRSLTNGTEVIRVLRELDTMLSYFADADPRDGEEPVLVEDMVYGLPKLIPLLMLIYGRAPT